MEDKFVNFAKYKVQEWLSHNVENLDGISTDDIFVVWFSKTLQNKKALLATRFASYYFECTYNGDKNEMYLDAYKKAENQCIEFDD